MRILPGPVNFEWDRGNIDKNQIKHGATNKEAEEVFKTRPNFILEDVKHSTSEKRYMIWSKTKEDRKLTIFFTMKNNKIRIISTRDMHKKERRTYEEKI